MKKFLLVSVFLFSNAFAGIQIISDLDDTVKVTNSGDILESVGYAIARNKVYAGMPEFLAGTRTYVNALTIVSSSPRILRLKVKKLMQKHGIQYESIILNKNFKRPNHIEYKTSAIEEILDKTTDSFILIGDDVGDDPEIYDYFIKNYPHRILASYIHVVKNREVPDSAIKYHTTFELAVKEFEAGRLLKQDVINVAEGILKVDDFESVFPNFAHCPAVVAAYNSTVINDFPNETVMITGALAHYCKYKWESGD